MIDNTLKKCNRCKLEFPRMTDYFYRNNRTKDGLSYPCKKCDNLVRTDRQKTKKSHNMPRRCALCHSFFWAALADINKGLRRNGKPGGRYCSVHCQRRSPTTGFKGKSWNGARRGENNPFSKYTEQTIKQVKVLLAQGMRNCDIARLLNVNQITISLVKTGKAWNSITL